MVTSAVMALVLLMSTLFDTLFAVLRVVMHVVLFDRHALWYHLRMLLLSVVLDADVGWLRYYMCCVLCMRCCLRSLVRMFMMCT